MASVVAHAVAIAPAAAAARSSSSSSSSRSGLKAHRSAFASGTAPSSARASSLRAAAAAASRSRAAASSSADIDTSIKAVVATKNVVGPTVAWPDAGPVARGSGWEVHKFGGTCVGSAERISGCCDLLINNAKSGVKTFGVVSAMGVINKSDPKVTDCLINATDMASSRNPAYGLELEKLEVKHRTTAEELLTKPEELAAYMKAFDDELNDLRAMLKAMSIAGTSTRAFADFVVGHGELWTARLCAAAIRCKGFDAEWIDARDVLVVMDAEDGGVDVDYERSNANLDKLFLEKSHGHPDRVLIATGFIARTPEGVPTTLRRNGSDYSATIFGALLISKSISIWTDVDGVYSADPRKVIDAVCLDQLSYNEAWELSYFGANVLHPRTTLPAMRYNIPITIRNYFNLSAPGTSISDKVDKFTDSVEVKKRPVKGIATIDDVCLINVEGTGMVGVPGTANAVFAAVKDAGCNVMMISQASSEHSICFAVRSNEADAAVNALNKRFEKAIAAGRIKEVTRINDCAILAAVGQNMCKTSGVSAMLFEALASASCNVVAISQGCSEYNITVVVSKKDVNKALRAVHGRFYLSKTVISVGLVGPGLVGKTLLRQMKEQLAELKEDYSVDLRVVAITGNSQMLLTDGSTTALDLDTWEADYAGVSTKSVKADMAVFMQHVADSGAPEQVIIDCSASAEVASHYLSWLKAGINVVTPNKKANSGPLAYYKELRSMQRNSYTHYFYEGTVGAGLPIISTVRGLLDSGDKVLKIEGIFSGTLSYIFNTYGAGQNFSDVVSAAKDLGYTEPDPRDDLSGTDVARKVVILARECGLDLELEDIPVQSLVPEALRATASVEEFMKELPKYDQDMAAQTAEAAAAGEKLRYVGVVDVKAGTGSVELRRYPADHPFAQLSGSDNIISFQTKRYCNQALVIRGPGAGAEVTAGGVFGDVLRVCQYLGAPS
mmetsp:Transcript_36478/g.89999  ORF Transcript_36478/g.89999 Transcript_36478/m.89999 type:complete len:953 (-) Transcript_36478:188-3046(-)|eukprot:CAMPEP_0197588018 /NCGR_PEP_ID=MMETSP1326-20131121/9448_1 /TAXON_ID=1155430 /ORGANISM="Genus nov. species nov., Strain RCC2288" /LENGTH=952 /DNA_ID=CAMNT_0043152803 /DNA_START=80 /DNA_END=2938 /DNA_ORIENTATION=-